VRRSGSGRDGAGRGGSGPRGEELGSEVLDPDNLLDRLADPAALARHYAYQAQRERELLDRHLGLSGGEVAAIGCGWHPGRHLFPAPQWRLTAVDVDGNCVLQALASGQADAGLVGRAGHLDELPAAGFDVVLYRLVLHHVAYREPLGDVFTEAARLLRPGGVFVAIEPNLWHPVGLGLAAANRLGVATRAHGTPDDIPLSPAALRRLAQAAGLDPELYAVTYSWRRLPARLQRYVSRLDRFGERPAAARLGHTILLLARRVG
jgi:SAM-dependent methyltransferase